jgi:hypothetical protein
LIQAFFESRRNVDGLLADLRNSDGFDKIAEAPGPQIEDDLRSPTGRIDDGSILRAMKSRTQRTRGYKASPKQILE